MFVSNVNRIGHLAIGLFDGQGRQVTSPSKAPKDNIGLRKDTRGFKEIQSIKMRLNEIAEKMKDSSANKDKIIEQIKAGLNGINKFFPPYPPGSEERVRLLKSYVAFRVLIERLTIPPETDVIGMTDENALERSISIREIIRSGDKTVTTNPEGIQELF